MPDSKKVSAGKPNISGAIWVAPLGTLLPKNATDKLDKAFKELGYVSDGGVKNSTKKTSNTKKAWGGDIILTTSSGQEDTFKFMLVESLNLEVLKFIYGEDNVTGDLDTGIKISVNASPRKDYVLVIETILQGGYLKRMLIPTASITETGEITYKDDDMIGYDVTVMGKADTTGNSHYEYINKKAD